MGRCSQADCSAAATCRPAFVIPFRNGDSPHRIVVPLEVCVRHGELIGEALASPPRRALLASACGPAAVQIDWDRCRLELVPWTPFSGAVERLPVA